MFEASFVTLECDMCGCIIEENEDYFFDKNEHYTQICLCMNCYNEYEKLKSHFVYMGR